MAYDQRNDRMVLFGGTPTPGGSVFLNETWVWDGSGWERLDMDYRPAPRRGANLAYDPVRREVVMFGGYGYSATQFTDTWVLRNNHWKFRQPETSPPGGYGYGQSMAFDPHSERVILFGGKYDGSYSDETWAWDGVNWTKLHPAKSPPGRAGGNLAFDPERDALVLFGGDDDRRLSDTWTWDGESWARETLLRSPPGGGLQPMTTFGQRLVLFGGHGDASTWILREHRWIRVHPHPAPPGRDYGSMAWDAVRSEAVFVGGRWEWDNSTWTLDRRR